MPIVDPLTASQWVSFEVFSNLNIKDLATCSQVCKKWKQHTSACHDYLWRNAIYREAKEKWETNFGEIEEGTLPPLNIRHILNSPCPISPQKKIFQTHILAFIPKTIARQSLTFKRLMQFEKASGFRYVRHDFIVEHGDDAVDEAYWVLMTKEVLPKSEGKNYSINQTLVEEMNYRVPTVLEAVVCIFMQYIATKERLFTNMTFTSCVDYINETERMVVGDFVDRGLAIFVNYTLRNVGIGGLRKLE